MPYTAWIHEALVMVVLRKLRIIRRILELKIVIRFKTGGTSAASVPEPDQLYALLWILISLTAVNCCNIGNKHNIGLKKSCVSGNPTLPIRTGRP